MRLTLGSLVWIVSIAGLSCGKSTPNVAAVASGGNDHASSPVAASSRPVGPSSTHPSCLDVGDLLDVQVAGLSSGLSQTIGGVMRVQADGTIHVPLLPDLKVAGLDRVATAKVIAQGYRSANMLSDAAVTVRRLQVAKSDGPAPGPIGPFDLVRCTVVGLEADHAQVIVQRVDCNGAVTPPYLRPIHVAGLTDGSAATAVAEAYRQANILQSGVVLILTLERAPPDAAHVALPDEPIQPVPEPLRFLYESK